MQFELTEDQQQLLDAADDIGRGILAPLAEEMDRTEAWPEGLWTQLGELGFMGLTAPESLGGSGLDVFTAGLVGMAFARWNPAVALSWGAHENLCMNNILRNGSPEQRARWIPGLCAGTSIGCLALTEPGAGSDALRGMATTAVRDGDDYVINGRKLWITNGPHADLVLLYAKTSPEKGAHGISAFVVERGTPGFAVAQKIEKMGFRGSQTGELVFDDCRVPAANLIGTPDHGVAIVMSGLDLERAFLALAGVGMGERCLELAVDYAKARTQFGRPIGKFQLIQAHLADMYTTLESMRALAYRALSACVALEVGGGGRGGIHQLTAASILACARGFKDIADRAVQVHGGMGYAWESEVNRLYRCAKLIEIGAGTNEVRQLIIGEELLRG